MRDGSMMDPFMEYRDMELIISSQETDGANRVSFTELVTVPKSSVVEYWLYPTANTEQITVTVSLKTKHKYKVNLWKI